MIIILSQVIFIKCARSWGMHQGIALLYPISRDLCSMAAMIPNLGYNWSNFCFCCNVSLSLFDVDDDASFNFFLLFTWIGFGWNGNGLDWAGLHHGSSFTEKNLAWFTRLVINNGGGDTREEVILTNERVEDTYFILRWLVFHHSKAWSVECNICTF